MVVLSALATMDKVVVALRSSHDSLGIASSKFSPETVPCSVDRLQQCTQ